MKEEYNMNVCPICNKDTDNGKHEVQINETTNQINIKCLDNDSVIVIYNIFNYSPEPKTPINYCPDCGSKICECVEVEDDPNRTIYICPECGITFNALINKLDSEEE